MSQHPPTSLPPEATSLPALVLLLRFQGIAVDAAQITHQYGRNIGITEMLRCAKDLKLKARVIESNWDRLTKPALPAIAQRRDGSFFIVSKVAEGTLLILDPAVGYPQSLARAEFDFQWNGRLILMARR